MADLKDIYSETFITKLGTQVHRALPAFSVARFQAACLTTDWADLKLMERRDRITVALHQQLPTDFEEAAPILRQIAPDFTGLAGICLPNYVAQYGLDHWQTAMDLLAELTRYSSSEFAIRPFLVKAPQRTCQRMIVWSHSSDAAVRRLASEGIRPRLPWGMRLPQFMADPAPVMAILENLIADESDYVQKSVANNLNDISKDNPAVVIAFAQRHWGQRSQTDWMLTRGLRTLFKQGQPEVLALQGYALTAGQAMTVELTPARQAVTIGESTTLAYTLHSTATTDLPVYLGYRVHYVRLHQATGVKDFFIKRVQLKPGQTLRGTVKVKWRQLTTRKLYPGDHRIELLVNTQPVAAVQVDLQDEG